LIFIIAVHTNLLSYLLFQKKKNFCIELWKRWYYRRSSIHSQTPCKESN